MWDFLQYTSREQAFNGLFRGSLKVTRAGAGESVEAGVWASRTALRIRCKLFLEYLGISVAATGATALGDFAHGGPLAV